VLTIDSSENTITVGRNRGPQSTKANPSPIQDNNGWEPRLVSPKNPFGGRPLARKSR